MSLKLLDSGQAGGLCLRGWLDCWLGSFGPLIFVSCLSSVTLILILPLPCTRLPLFLYHLCGEYARWSLYQTLEHGWHAGG